MCKSEKRCRICNKLHHSLLHREFKPSDNSPQKKPSPTPTPRAEPLRKTGSKQLITFAHNSVSSIVLPTMLIAIQDDDHKVHIARALIDSGSQSTCITRSFANQLNYPRHAASIAVSGIVANQSSRVEQTITFSFTPVKRQSPRFETTALILDKLTNNLPEYSFQPPYYEYLKSLNLADPSFNQSLPIDVILGGEEAFEVLTNGKRIYNPDRSLICLESPFGCIIMGKYHSKTHPTSTVYFHVVVKNPPSDLITKIRELEEIPILSKILSPQDKLFELSFN